MDAGVVAEIGPPSELLARPDSAFSALVDKTGPAGAAALRQMAADFYKERKDGIAIGSHPRPSLDQSRARASLEIKRSLEMARHPVASRPGLARIESVQFQD
jgi:hypothetical protein